MSAKFYFKRKPLFNLPSSNLQKKINLLVGAIIQSIIGRDSCKSAWIRPNEILPCLPQSVKNFFHFFASLEKYAHKNHHPSRSRCDIKSCDSLSIELTPQRPGARRQLRVTCKEKPLEYFFFCASLFESNISFPRYKRIQCANLFNQYGKG